MTWTYYSLRGHVISPLSSFKFLGLYIDEHRSRPKFVFILRKLKIQLSERSLSLRYNALVYANLLYCSSVWSFASKALLNQLNVRQIGIIRMIGNVSPREHTAPLFNRLKFLTFDKSIIYVCLLFVFKSILYHSSYDWFSFYENTSYNTRRYNMHMLIVPFVRTTH